MCPARENGSHAVLEETVAGPAGRDTPAHLEGLQREKILNDLIHIGGRILDKDRPGVGGGRDARPAGDQARPRRRHGPADPAMRAPSGLREGALADRAPPSWLGRDALRGPRPLRCEACWSCVEACPEAVFGKVAFFRHRHALVAAGERCTGCLRCVKACTASALSRTQGWRVRDASDSSRAFALEVALQLLLRRTAVTWSALAAHQTV